MKVLIVCREYGLASEVWMIRQALAMDGMECSFLAWSTRKFDSNLTVLREDFDFDQRGLGRWFYRIVNYFHRNFFYPPVSLINSLQKLCATQGKPDVILCHYGSVALRVLPVARRFNIPVVVHFHGNDISSSLRDKYYRWSLTQNAKHFASAVVVGSRQREDALALGFDDKNTFLIPCGAPSEQFTPKEYYNNDVIQYITVSRLVPWKGVDYVIKAFARLYQEKLNVVLHVVGGGEQQESLITLCRELGVESAVKFYSELAPEGVHSLMKQSDVFIQHSLDYMTGWYEGFGVSVTEACLTGLPVIVTNSGGLSDQIQDRVNGLVVEQKSVDSTYQAMKELFQNEELRSTLGKSARDKALVEYDATMLSLKLQAVLKSAASD